MGAYISRLMGAYASRRVGAAATAIIAFLVEYFIVKRIRKNQSIFDQIETASPVSAIDKQYGTNKTVYVEGVSLEPYSRVPKPPTTTEKIWSLFMRGRWPETVPIEKLESLAFRLKVQKGFCTDHIMPVKFRNPSKATYVMGGLWTAVQDNKEKAAFDLTYSETRLVGYGAVISSTSELVFKPPENGERWFILANMSREELYASFRNKLFLLYGLLVAIPVIGAGMYWIYYYRNNSYRGGRGDDNAGDENAGDERRD